MGPLTLPLAGLIYIDAAVSFQCERVSRTARFWNRSGRKRKGDNYTGPRPAKVIVVDHTRAATRVKGPGGDVDVKNNGMTMIIEVSNRGIVDYADQILNSPD